LRILVSLCAGQTQNVPAVHTKKIWIAFHGPPLSLPKAHQLAYGWTPDLTRASVLWSGMVNGVLTAIFANLTGAEIDHAVVWLLTRLLPEEKQISLLSCRNPSAYEMAI
jgi:hypothetical protein